MPSNIIDSIFFQDLYGTAEMRAVFNDLSLLQRWLDTEVALARAEAELGIIPTSAADEIARRAHAENLDTAHIKQLIDQTVHPIVPVIRVLADACDGDAGEYVHWGATTQDIMDTANILQLKQAITIFERRLALLADTLAELARKHRDTVMAGRTHGQQALPITFGFKLAILLAEVERHQERLAQCQPRLLVGQFAGAVGTLASVPEQGVAIQQRMMELLGLGVPRIAWHTARDTIAEFTALLGMIAATVGKMAHEVITLQMTELDEVEEPFNEGKVGSSTMPHKRNPMLCEAILALSQLVINTVPSALAAMGHEHERDWARQHIEWAFVPEACIMTDGALSLITRVLQGLRVNPEKMARNLEELDGMMMSEAVMLMLAQHVGRQTAHEIVYSCAMRAIEEGKPFRSLLAEQPIVAQYLSSKEVEQLLDPRRYTGLAGQFVDRIVGKQRLDGGQTMGDLRLDSMDWHAWMAQHLPFTEIKRGGATVWPRGGSGLIGDSLGPIMHIHDGATEIFYFIKGRCRLEIGDSEEIFGPGDFVLVPPEVPHNLWNAGDEDLLVFWLVAPNFIQNKWRTTNFPPGAMERRAIRSHVLDADELPSDDKLRSRVLALSAGKSFDAQTAEQQEAVVYVLDGTAQVTVGKLSGRLVAHDFVNVPVGTRYSIEAAEMGASILLFEMPGA